MKKESKIYFVEQIFYDNDSASTGNIEKVCQHIVDYSTRKAVAIEGDGLRLCSVKEVSENRRLHTEKAFVIQPEYHFMVEKILFPLLAQIEKTERLIKETKDKELVESLPRYHKELIFQTNKIIKFLIDETNKKMRCPVWRRHL